MSGFWYRWFFQNPPNKPDELDALAEDFMRLFDGPDDKEVPAGRLQNELLARRGTSGRQLILTLHRAYVVLYDQATAGSVSCLAPLSAAEREQFLSRAATRRASPLTDWQDRILADMRQGLLAWRPEAFHGDDLLGQEILPLVVTRLFEHHREQVMHLATMRAGFAAGRL